MHVYLYQKLIVKYQNIKKPFHLYQKLALEEDKIGNLIFMKIVFFILLKLVFF